MQQRGDHMVEVRILFGAWLAVKTKSEVGESVGGIGGGRLSERLVALTLGGGGHADWVPPGSGFLHGSKRRRIPKLSPP